MPDSPRIGSLCSGYGGLDLGLMAVVGGAVAWHVEYDKHPSAVLDVRFPGVPNYGDVTTTDWSQVEPVDWLTAGYPCQPFSHAGKRKGKDDERHLWPFVADAVGALRPRRALLENVAGHVSLGLDAVLWDLAALGYDTTWGVVRASDAGAPHGRARIFIVATDAQCADGWSAVGDSGASGEHLAAPRRVEGAAAPRGDRPVASDSADGGRWGAEGQQRGLGTPGRVATAAADASGVGRGSGAGLRESQPRGIGRGRPDHDDGEAPADPEGDRRDEGRPEPARLVGRPHAAERSHDVPTDADECGSQGVGRIVTLGRDADRCSGADVAWGNYEPAVRRWEHVTGRAAPRPTEPGRTGERLSPRFVEWLMGLPDGWVTDVLPRSPALKALGNGVVPQQAALALRTLLRLEQVAA